MAAVSYALPNPPRPLSVDSGPAAVRGWLDLGRWVLNVTDWLGQLRTLLAQVITADQLVRARSYAVADLPVVTEAGLCAYASNGRKNGEGAGLGTGVLVFSDSTFAWKACDTGQTVAA